MRCGLAIVLFDGWWGASQGIFVPAGIFFQLEKHRTDKVLEHWRAYRLCYDVNAPMDFGLVDAEDEVASSDDADHEAAAHTPIAADCEEPVALASATQCSAGEAA